MIISANYKNLPIVHMAVGRFLKMAKFTVS